MNAVSGIPSSGYQGSQVASASAAMGKNEFLGLLVTQLANQDPLNPMDNQQFAAQLAQFSSLEQMSNIQQTLEQGLSADQALAGALQGGMAADLIGRRVTVLDDRLELDGQGATLRWEAESTPARVTAEVLDSAGTLVHSFNVEDPAATSSAWDGRNAQGQELPEGTYTLRLSAVDAAGAAVTVRPLWQGRVETVRFREGVPWLVGGGLEFSLAQVSEVTEAGEGGTALGSLLGGARPYFPGL